MPALRGCQTRAVFAYDERLRLLPAYLQQLEMESNGKSVTADGAPVSGATAPVTWGGVGTDAQHAVFQLLHQGTHLIPGRFRRGDRTGRCARSGAPPQPARQLLRARRGADGRAHSQGPRARLSRATGPRRRSCSTSSIPASFGALIAFHEHRTFANAVLMGINPFDQFGVELGKDIARQIEQGGARFDASTQALLAAAGIGA